MGRFSHPLGQGSDPPLRNGLTWHVGKGLGYHENLRRGEPSVRIRGKNCPPQPGLAGFPSGFRAFSVSGHARGKLPKIAEARVSAARRSQLRPLHTVVDSPGAPRSALVPLSKVPVPSTYKAVLLVIYYRKVQFWTKEI
jgi:hypothetical protein